MHFVSVLHYKCYGAKIMFYVFSSEKNMLLGTTKEVYSLVSVKFFLKVFTRNKKNPKCRLLNHVQ